MPSVPDKSPATGNPVPPSYIHTTALNFVDNHGRTLLLRGVNLSGSSKAPLGRPSQVLDDFWESAERDDISFVGQPLSLEDGSADVHLARLRGWGFNFLRFPFTWEALEHSGPKQYDYEFMDYLVKILCKCRDYGFRVYMDPHQDTWSRFSGGSGAPFWTLAACGIDPRNITATQAAILHPEYPMAHTADPASLPAMVWSTNYGRLLSQTVFTLFFAGKDFAPNCILDGVNIQDYLQSHFIEACGQLADRIRAFDGGSLFEETVIGWDSLNEPFEGLCGWEDLNVNPTKQGSTLKKGTYPTPAQSMRLGMGQAQTVDNWTFGTMGPARDGSVTVDPKGRKVWAEAGDEGEQPDGTHPRWGWKRDVRRWPLGTCIWAQHGVWDVSTGFVLQPEYFKYRPSKSASTPLELVRIEVEFVSDYWKPHWLAYAHRLRRTHEEAIIFVQPPVFAYPPHMTEDEVRGRCAYSPHYYDGLTLVTRHWNWFNADALGLLRGKYRGTLGAVKIGEGAIRKSLQEQIGYLQDDVAVIGGEGRPGLVHSEGLEDVDADGRSTHTTYGGISPRPSPGKYPTVLGEIGTPFDMDSKRSYGWTDSGKHFGDYSQQEKALDASLNACDGARPTSWTMWTYVVGATHEWGDGWNMEDLSLWCADDVWWDEEEEDDNEENGGDKEMMHQDENEDEEEPFNSRAGLLTPQDRKNQEEAQLDDVEMDQRGRQGCHSDKKAPTSRRKNTDPDTDVQPVPEPPMMAPRQRQKAKAKKHSTSNLNLGVGPSAMSLDTMRSSSSGPASSSSSSSERSSSGERQRGRRRVGINRIRSYNNDNADDDHPHPLEGLDGYTALNPYEFLTNGARAIRAAARPWPVKVVGVPTDVRFDVGRGWFRLGVWVGEEDRDPSLAGGAGKRGGEEGEEEEESRATELYIPLVHYATQKMVDEAYQSRASQRQRLAPPIEETARKDITQQPPVKEGASHSGTPPDSEAETVVEELGNSMISEETKCKKDKQKADDTGKGRSGFQSRVPCLVGDTWTSLSVQLSDSEPLPLVDLEVKISTGHFKVVGQRLLWWYDVPGPGEPRRRVDIEVRRRGGPIGVDPNMRWKGRREGRNYGKDGEGLKEKDRGGWCDLSGWCGDGGCAVM